MKEKISIIATLVNILLTTGKIVAGLLSGSVALLAEAVHSGLDIFSSAITYLGIKIAKKPEDEKHPYGYYNAETITSFIIVILLFITSIWIIYEGVININEEKGEVFSILGLIIMFISAIINEIMARIKLHYGQLENSLPLISDAEHSRVDVFASLGVLFGLIASKYYPSADGIIAVVVGLFILYETFNLSKEIVDSFLDSRDETVENRIREIFKQNNIKISAIKSRKIGGYTSAETKIDLDKNIQLMEADRIIKTLEAKTKKQIDQLKYITISFNASGENYTQKTTFRPLGGLIRKRFHGGGFSQFVERRNNLNKKDEDVIIIPLEDDNIISPDFGSDKYLKIIFHNKSKKIICKNIINNKFAEDGFKRGGRFIKEIGATKIITKSIGNGAKENFQKLGVEVIITKINEVDKIINSIMEGGD